MSKGYSFSIYLQDLVSSPLMKMARLYEGTIGKMTRSAQRMAGLFRPVVQSAEELRAKLNSLKGNRELMVDARQIKAADREIDKLERKLAKLTGRDSKGRFVGNGSSSKQSGSGGWLMGGIKGLLPTLGVAGLLAAGGSALGSGMNREQIGLQIQQFLKTPEATSMMMGRLNKFADVTPYSNEEVYQSGRSMLAARIGPGELLGKMNNVGNLAAGSGKSFSDLSQSYSKIKMKDFIDGGELHMEFGGTLLMEQLKKNLGVGGDDLFKMAEKRQIRFKDVDKAIADMTTGNGDYAGSLDKLAGSAGGKMSTFMGTFGNKIAEWAATQNSTLGKIFDFGTEFLSKMKPLEDAVSGLIHAFKPLGESLYGILITFGLVSEGGSGVEGVIRALAGVVNILATAVQVATSPLGQLILLFAGLVKGALLLSTVGVGGLITSLQALWVVMLTNPITAILIGLLAIGTGLKMAWDNCETFRQGVITMWETVKSIFGRLATIALDFATQNWSGIIDQIKAAWAEGMTNGANSYLKDHDERYGKLVDRRKARRERLNGENNLAGAFGNNPMGGMGNTKSGDSKGIESGVSGAKSTNITINLKSLIEGGVHVHSATVREGIAELRDMLIDDLTRVVNSANSIPS